MMGFLKQFYDFTMKVSGSSYVTSNLFFPEVVILYRLLKKWKRSPDYDLSLMASKMRIKYEKYWGNIEKMNKVLYIVIVLDSRRKMTFVDYTLYRVYPEEDKGKLLAYSVKKPIYDLYDHYVKTNATSSQPASTSSLPTIIEEDDPIADFNKYMEQVDGVIHKLELDKYLREERDDMKDPNFNVLNWWKLNCHQFPILSQMAKNVLVAPISTLSSESAFSTGGRVLDEFKRSLTPRIAEALICTQDWLRAVSCPVSVEEDPLEIGKIDEGINFLFKLNLIFIFFSYVDIL
ncbi:Zinc finger BED domain-containing protein RICESLEEPER 2 [Linum grandiflorum]